MSKLGYINGYTSLQRVCNFHEMRKIRAIVLVLSGSQPYFVEKSNRQTAMFERFFYAPTFYQHFVIPPKPIAIGYTKGYTSFNRTQTLANAYHLTYAK